MIVLSRYDVPEADAEAFLPLAEAALAAFSACPGFLRGSVGRSNDVTTAWLLTTEWEGVASARRSLSPYDVKVTSAALGAWAQDGVNAFEVLVRRDEAVPGLPPVSSRAR